MLTSRRILLLGLAAMPAGCGGGGSPSPSPSPAPSPAPAPSPTPTPPPATTAVRATSSGTMIANFSFYSTPPNQDGIGGDVAAQGWGTADGLFLSGSTPPRFVPGSSIVGPITSGDLARFAKRAGGFDTASQTYIFLDAPADAVSVTPATSLITYGAAQDRIKSAFSMRSGIYQVNGDPDLLRLDATGALQSADPAVQRQGEQLVAAHLRIMAAASAFNTIGGFTGHIGPAPAQLFLDNVAWGPLARYIGQSGPDLELISTAGARAFAAAAVARRPAGAPALRADVQDAAASLMANFLIGIGPFIPQGAESAAWTIGITALLVADLQRLITANSAAAATEAFAQLAPQFRARVQPFRNARPWASPSRLFVANKAFEMRAGDLLVLATAENPAPGEPQAFYSFSLYASNGTIIGGVTLVSVSVPAERAAEIAASVRSDGKVEVRGLGSFVGVSWFDYTLRHTSGEQATGRAFITVLPRA